MFWFFMPALVLVFTYLYFIRKRKYADINKLPGPPTVPIFGSVLEFGSNTVGGVHLTFNFTMFWFFMPVLVLVYTYLYFIRKRKYADINKLPGPPTVPIFGSVLEFRSNTVDILNNLQRLNDTYGSVFKMWIGPFIPSIIVTDEKYLEYFLSSSVHIHKSTSYDLFFSWLGTGLISSPGNDKWRRNRKLLTPAFHFKILEKFIDAFDEAARILVDKLKMETHKSLDIYPYINANALDVLCDTSMGVKLNIQNNPNNEYSEALGNYLEMFSTRQFSLLNRFDFFFNWSSDSKKWNKYIAIIKYFTEKVIRDRRCARKTARHDSNDVGITKRPTFLDLLLDLADEKNVLTDENIREEVDTFMFAGHDTVSSAISLGLFEIAKYPNIQQNILDETDTYLGKDKDAQITFKDLQNMNYLERVCKEMLRIHPAVPYFERQLYEDVKVDGISIPKGTIIGIPPYLIHRSETLYKNSKIFDPDRFTPENCAVRNPFHYIPFSAGPRNCIGQRVAMLEMKATIATLVRNFEFSSVQPEHKLQLGINVTLRSMNGVPVIIRPRS